MKRTLTYIALTVAVAAVWVVVLPPAPAAQPLSFDHSKHAAVSCSVCHRGATSSARAGIPQADLCSKCHATVPGGVRKETWEAAARNGRFEWRRVSRVPEHVYFSHQRHAGAARLECASCHGTVGQSTAPPRRAPLRLDMDACLSCHEKEAASRDCAACHR